MRVMERSRAKSSAAKIRPERWGEARQMEVRSVRALADSISAMMEGGGRGGSEAAVARVCRITSVMKWRSEAEFTLGTTMALTLGARSWAID